MAILSEDKSAVLHTLLDAGCGDETINQFFLLYSHNKIDEIFCLLSNYRRRLLDTIHGDQKRIDILDYLIYNMRKEHTQ